VPKTIEVRQSIFADNDALATGNRRLLDVHHVMAINVMASPGAGKTTLILATAEALAPRLRCGVIEGDIAGDIDTVRVKEAGIPAVQVNTGGSCHLRAGMVECALAELPLAEMNVLFIENVGNLVCPAGVRLGEHLRLVVSSTPEGDDKPTKYPAAFREADAVVVSKWDVAQYVGFDMERYEHALRRINSALPIFRLSARTGEGMQPWADWVIAKVAGRGV
jgi:hydrogenase nickel incorporation protein HypB